MSSAIRIFFPGEKMGSIMKVFFKKSADAYIKLENLKTSGH